MEPVFASMFIEIQVSLFCTYIFTYIDIYCLYREVGVMMKRITMLKSTSTRLSIAYSLLHRYMIFQGFELNKVHYIYIPTLLDFFFVHYTVKKSFIIERLLRKK